MDPERRTRSNGLKFEQSSFYIQCKYISNNELSKISFWSASLRSFSANSKLAAFLDIPGSFPSVSHARVTNTEYLFLPVFSV
jgi:hypothetical protein